MFLSARSKRRGDRAPGLAGSAAAGAGARCRAAARRRQPRFAHPHARCRGFSLLEILFTVFIVGVGLLGLGQLSIVSNQASRDAFFQGQAGVLAYDMIDRMRANRLVAIGGGYDLAYADADPAGATVEDVDRADWRNLLDRALPQGEGQISRAGNVLTVSVRWPDPMTGGLRETTVSSEL